MTNAPTPSDDSGMTAPAHPGVFCITTPLFIINMGWMPTAFIAIASIVYSAMRCLASVYGQHPW